MRNQGERFILAYPCNEILIIGIQFYLLFYFKKNYILSNCNALISKYSILYLDLRQNQSLNEKHYPKVSNSRYESVCS